MRAAWVSELGPAASIRVSDLPAPEAGPGEVLVRVEAVAVDPVDTLVRSGRYATPVPFPFIVGRDLVGTVVATGAGAGAGGGLATDAAGSEPSDRTLGLGVGDRASGLAVGDRVWCNSLGHGGRQGATAEFVSVAADRLYRLPAGVDAVRAVAVLHPLATAHLALFTHGGLSPSASPAGDGVAVTRAGADGAAAQVVVAGGAGNVGSALVALARAAGARVVATSSAADTDYVAGLGADAVVDYRSVDWVDRVFAELPGGASLAVDTSGGLGFDWALTCVRPRGVIVVMAGFGRDFPLPVGPLYTHDLTIRGFAISTATVDELADAASTVNRVLSTSDFAARTVEVIGFDGVARAHDLIERREAGSTRFVVVP